jgi:hypothetical protein
MDLIAKKQATNRGLWFFKFFLVGGFILFNNWKRINYPVFTVSNTARAAGCDLPPAK